jgi:hypothetical protein
VTVKANTERFEIIVGSLSRCKREHTPLSVATAYQNENAQRCTDYAPFLPGPRVTVPGPALAGSAAALHCSRSGRLLLECIRGERPG